MPIIPGKYEFIKSEKFEEYMQAIGVGFILRKIGSTTKPTIVIAKNNDEWSIKTLSTFKNTEIIFKLNEEFSEVTVDGRHCQSTVRMEGDNKLIQTQLCKEKDQNLTIVREFTDTELKATLIAPSVTATHLYKKVE